MKKILFATVIALLIPFAAGTVGAQMSVEEIVKKGNIAAYYQGDDGLADVKMTIKDAQGRQRQRQFRILRKDAEDGGEQKFYVYFSQPADVAETVFMVWKHIGKDDDRWLYLPALDLVRRIAAGDKRSSFVGSNFTYEDVSGRGLEEDTHELIGETDEFYQVKNVPKQPKLAEFAYYIVSIRKDNFLPVKAEYYNKADKLIRVIEAQEVKDVEGNPTIVKQTAKDLQSGGETNMEFSNVDYNAGITDDIFAERYLRRPPVKWIRK
jgi:outer membrane lipoprotein-sorting protein